MAFVEHERQRLFEAAGDRVEHPSDSAAAETAAVAANTLTIALQLIAKRGPIRWGDLGPPTHPCEIDYYGKRVIVTARDIEAARGDLGAIFTATPSPVLAGERYTLGSVEFPFPGD